MQRDHKNAKEFPLRVGSDSTKIAWIEWENICKLKNVGG